MNQQTTTGRVFICGPDDEVEVFGQKVKLRDMGNPRLFRNGVEVLPRITIVFEEPKMNARSRIRAAMREHVALTGIYLAVGVVAVAMGVGFLIEALRRKS